ncbi:MAG: hypothetical protein A2383_02675 [Candidatus Pacebacteria bacterium RIFOXYB1_FULL_39_46]|nr:MAG: hypothetical protein A2383_02675 [Candidatus Pacebacteria bacterium RIFOXYB1_FULL_39_46]OGJ39286.1 MAG: hypothetical protein A2182_02940 [Candidatus Pacebacteria bacterium RIFOXYA1_FULL_38_18]OGJ40966.1 MAG: hypothetical protein A2582_01600 [Candidatus Pacebacteria bacterium RIFOXYD1_FULL_39_27]OGJ41147.1 MAG: hypothetical protein A2411_01520 [Candidatus Pacebacteria bacterium RIFOXYC1_FULL_39_21]
MKEQVQNCNVGKTFEVVINSPFFPVNGSGVVFQEWCNKETSEFPDGYAHLCTDTNRQNLLCHNTRCENQKAEGS